MNKTAQLRRRSYRRSQSSVLPVATTHQDVHMSSSTWTLLIVSLSNTCTHIEAIGLCLVI